VRCSLSFSDKLEDLKAKAAIKAQIEVCFDALLVVSMLILRRQISGNEQRRWLAIRHRGKEDHQQQRRRPNPSPLQSQLSL